MGAAKAKAARFRRGCPMAVGILLVACCAPSHRVNSFSRPGVATKRGPAPGSSSPLGRLFGKRPRSLATAEPDVEDPPLASMPYLIDALGNGADALEGGLSSRPAPALLPIDAPDDGEKASENPTIDGDGDSLLKKLFLGIEPTPDVLAISAVYFVEGALGLARLAQTFLLKDELHLGPAELSATMGVLALPWTIKPLYGFLSDGLPIFGYRRRSYLVLAGLVGFLGYTSLSWGLGAGSESMLAITVVSLMLSSASIALADAVADGIVVQKTRDAVTSGDDPAIAGGLQSVCWGSAAIGGLISAYFSGSLLETMSPREVFGIASFLPLLVGAMSLLIEEEPVKKGGAVGTNGIDGSKNGELTINGGVNGDINEGDNGSGDAMSSVRDQVTLLWDALRQPSIWKPVLFIFLWQATPTSDGAMLYFLTNDIGFGPELLGRVRLVTAASSLLGVWLYNQYLRQVAIKDVLLWTSIISVPLGLTQLLLISHYNRELGIPDNLFVLGDDVVLSILGEMAFLPTLVLAARLCPPGVEAVLFATLMSIYNGAGTVGTEIGAALTKLLGVTESDFSNLALLTVVCNVSSLAPLALIGLLDGVGEESQEDMEAMQANRDS